jgi:hypothetical protein
MKEINKIKNLIKKKKKKRKRKRDGEELIERVTESLKPIQPPL